MDDIFARFWSDLVGRLSGPMQFRLFLQPTMAAIYAYRDGVSDARANRPAYFWAMFTQPAQAWPLLVSGLKAVGRVILLGIAMDLIYQLITVRTVYPLELIVVVLALAFAPYLLLRGPFNRLARMWLPRPGRPTRR